MTTLVDLRPWRAETMMVEAMAVQCLLSLLKTVVVDGALVDFLRIGLPARDILRVLCVPEDN